MVIWQIFTASYWAELKIYFDNLWFVLSFMWDRLNFTSFFGTSKWLLLIQFDCMSVLTVVSWFTWLTFLVFKTIMIWISPCSVLSFSCDLPAGRAVLLPAGTVIILNPYIAHKSSETIIALLQIILMLIYKL